MTVQEDADEEEDSQCMTEETAGPPQSTPRRPRAKGQNRFARASKTRLDFEENTEHDSSEKTTEVSK